MRGVFVHVLALKVLVKVLLLAGPLLLPFFVNLPVGMIVWQLIGAAS